MDNRLAAKASITVDAPLARVWDALMNPDVIRLFMFGTIVKSEWKRGSPITWSGT